MTPPNGYGEDVLVEQPAIEMLKDLGCVFRCIPVFRGIPGIPYLILKGILKDK